MKRGLDVNTKYDVIVIGAGNGGLVAALELVKSGKKVLVLESANSPGGFATSFIRGRFEFEASLQNLCEFGTKENPGKLYKLFEKLGILDKLEFAPVQSTFHVYSLKEQVDYKLPFGVDAFIHKMNEYVPGCLNSMNKFFLLAEESYNALLYLEENKGYVDQNYFKKNFVNFLKVSIHTVDKVMASLKMPKKAQEIITSFWVHIGSPGSRLSFVHFASLFYSYISKGIQIPYNRSYQISLLLADEIEKLGGEIKYLSTVKEILFKENTIVGVLLNNGKIYEAKHIISNVSPTNVYGKLIPKPMVPKDAVKLTNSRVLGARGFAIYLGLNQSAKDLGLEEYSYTILENLDSNKEYQNRSLMKNCGSVVTVLNNAISTCSCKGTTIVQFTGLFMGDVFSKNVNEKNYFDLKDRVAENMINAFEKATGIIIKPYIEEIEIASPLTFARYSAHPDGVIFGYKATGMDNLLPRMLSQDDENYILNLRFCGGFEVNLAGFHSTYLSGDLSAKQTLKDMKGEEI